MTRLGWSTLLLVACVHAPPVAGPPPASIIALYTYSVDVSAVPTLGIEATFDPGGVADLTISDDVSDASRVEVFRDGAWKLVSSENGTWHVPECLRKCKVRYEINLDHCRGGEDGIAKVGASYLAPSYAWLLHPTPIMRSRFEIAMTPAHAPTSSWADVPWVGSMRDLGDGKRGLLSGDFAEGSFAAFGKVRTRTMRIAGGDVEPVILDRKLAMGEPALDAWVHDAATCVATLYGHFPVPHASIFFLPLPDVDEPVFGKVLSLGGSTILVLTGADSDGAKMHKDWILVHEMVHLGFPTFQNEGRWLGEGIATYYEPVLRTRMGWRDSVNMWRGFAREMPRGLPEKGEAVALEERHGIDAIYWGGAIFVMLADVRIRQATKGQMSLDDVMRGILAKGGDAEHVWTVADTMRAGDTITSTHVLTDMYERYAIKGEAMDLDGELHALGIDRTGHEDDVTFHDDRPHSWIRAKIVAPVVSKDSP